MGIAKYRFDELAEGMSAEFSVTITQSMMQSFAELSGDYNPLHLDADFAKSQVGGGGVLCLWYAPCLLLFSFVRDVFTRGELLASFCA